MCHDANPQFVGWDVIDLRLLKSKKVRDAAPQEPTNGAGPSPEPLHTGSSTEHFSEPKKKRKSLGRWLFMGVLLLLLLYVVIYQVIPRVSTVLMGQKADEPFVSAVLELTDGQKVTRSYVIQDSQGGTYFGPMEALAYVGTGEFSYKGSGGDYKGEFRDSKRDGKGTFTWSNGDAFEGDWSSDEMVSGTYFFSDGRKYTGTFDKGKPGNGTFIVPEGYGGSGIKSLEATIEGGNIKSVNMVVNDGSQYNGMLTGHADIVYPSGSTYSGMMKNGLRNGDGEYRWVENGAVQAYYEGYWMDDKMSGKGTYHYTSEAYPSIQGDFINGKPSGKATYYKEADNTFETVWKNGSCISVTET